MAYSDLYESPIERRLGEAMLDVFSEMALECELGDGSSSMIASLPSWHSLLMCQLDLGWCRPDFLLLSTVPFSAAEMGYAKVPGEYENMLIVEVDGHEYHERTKEQARRDRSRDRRMLELSWVPLRFTGQEIHQDARACARQAINFYFERQQKIMDRAFTEYMVWRAVAEKGLNDAELAAYREQG